MSTRWYPLYQRGNPQLRVFLPNFWMKLIRPTHEQPPNVVQFACSMEMTKFDVKNYLEKIYNIENIVDVRTRIALGKTKRDPRAGYVTKDEDTKIAYVVLPKTEIFKFPDLFPNESEDEERRKEEMKSLEVTKENHRKFLEKSKNRKGIPSWFSI
ncbi:probable 39S ribosomal protein L23, mitochondrial [Chrysoperla carnea]|uniref:probable 39S ribosomal protein L23, mitochondrial n=1 Tax=Chrysoperla carnea TaxID=189513 RepID=UPI001D09841C|nr:probable 39S ribosomal protein L23, mitochondrial [Chrysoperla carnea]